MKSLFVLSLPRSLSTLLYEASAAALGLEQPFWTSGGEILNRERVPFRHRRHAPEEARFTVAGCDPAAYVHARGYLDFRTQTRGFAYKDVVQPFVLADWGRLPDFAVLKVRRDVAEVAYAMLKREWHYPARAASVFRELPWSLVEGLVRAETALAALPGATVAYEDATASHAPLQEALGRLYPGSRCAPLDYIDRRFARTRARLLAERAQSRLFRELRDAVEVVRAALGIEEPPLTTEAAERSAGAAS